MLRSSKNADQRKQWWYRVAGYSAVANILTSTGVQTAFSLTWKNWVKIIVTSSVVHLDFLPDPDPDPGGERLVGYSFQSITIT